MGKTAEAGDDIPVTAGKVEIVPKRGVGVVLEEPLKQGDAEILQLQALGMLQGQVEEEALYGEKMGVMAMGQPLQAELLSAPILGKRSWLPPTGVARQLIEQQQQGEAAFRLPAPVVEFPLGGLPLQRAKLQPELPVYFLILTPPEAGLALGQGSGIGRFAKPGVEQGIPWLHQMLLIVVYPCIKGSIRSPHGVGWLPLGSHGVDCCLFFTVGVLRMAGTSLLALLDDIAAVLDDVALMTKVAAKKTAGVLGDDLALNAEQVSGVRAERELPVVWAVAKGSFRNKLILVPAALLISALVPWLITPLLMLGGAYLCFEGAEKLAHKFLAHDAEDQGAAEPIPDDLVAYEKEKVKGAIRTDFILSAEIIVIALGTVQGSAFPVQVSVVAGIAVLMTIGVYGLVGLIVKLDDIGLHLVNKGEGGTLAAPRLALGRALVVVAPKLMHLLALVGTIAMFMVGGGILAHGLAPLHHLIEGAAQSLAPLSGLVAALVPSLLSALFGIVAGLVLVGVMSAIGRLRG